MKILFINKYDNSGGAAITAMRLSNALTTFYNTENKFLVAVKKSSLPFVSTTRDQGWQHIIERGWNIITNQFGFQYFYFPFSTKKILQFSQQWQPDIISLHNIHGGYFDLSLLPELSGIAPSVWTLHDMWAFTANAAHTFGDSSWKHLKAGKKEHRSFPKTGIASGNKLLVRKKELYQKSNLHIVVPSLWLGNLASQSPLFKNKQIIHIPNGVNMNYFTPDDKLKIRTELGLPTDKRIITFSAEKLMKSEYKGGKELIKVLQELDHHPSANIMILMIGNHHLPISFNNLQCHYTGYVNEETMMIKYLQSSDIFFYPTKADNLPNSLIEAIACGIPCITFDVGGCREIIRNNFNGFVITPGDINSFAEKAISLLQDANMHKRMEENARQFAIENFDIRNMAAGYFKLFSEILKK